MKDELNITLRIADQGPFPMTVSPQDEEYMRKAESHVNQLWDIMRRRYPERSSAELLAIVAWQFARLNITQDADVKAAEAAAASTDAALTKLLDMQP